MYFNYIYYIFFFLIFLFIYSIFVFIFFCLITVNEVLIKEFFDKLEVHGRFVIYKKYNEDLISFVENKSKYLFIVISLIFSSLAASVIVLNGLLFNNYKVNLSPSQISR